MSTKHTPTPWKVVRVSDVLIGVQDANGFSVADAAAPSNRSTANCAANAAFIVKAVNAHDALTARVAELEKALREIADGNLRSGLVASFARAALERAK